jgi:transcriptional antiterminator NusG
VSTDREPLNERQASDAADESSASTDRTSHPIETTSPVPADIAADSEGKTAMDAQSTDREHSQSGATSAGDNQGSMSDEVASDNVEIEESDDSTEEVEEEVREPLELIEEGGPDEEITHKWYILKVQVNREDSIRDALQRRVKIEGLDRYFADIIVPTEDVAEFTKTGKRRIIKRKLYPGYIMVNMHINDDTWFLVRETPGIGDFTGSAGKPTPMDPREVDRIRNLGKTADEGDTHVKTAIPFKQSDRVRVKDGYFQNFEGDVESVDEANGRVTVMINIFGRSTPVELEHWQIEAV